ncbi:MAG: type II toxin-antitoxin system RelE/ParE family toxin [Candidatus Hydrogenedentes bacterium]|nr:type II toxin-antitoxin system RelE/ParE family toxin [Candidatus Hydrogenedentota bacterium]
MRVFKAKVFARFVAREGISDASLLRAVDKAEQGLIDANLGGGVIKLRVARQGQGESGAYRTLLAFRSGVRVVFLHGFAKSGTTNITKKELDTLKRAAKVVLSMSDEDLQRLVVQGKFVEVK